jgi:hypothetical protein
MIESCNKEENSKYVIHLVILYFIIFICKKIINFIFRNGIDFASNKNKQVKSFNNFSKLLKMRTL